MMIKLSFCEASWKCSINDGSKLKGIKDEDEVKLKSAGCFRSHTVQFGIVDKKINKSEGVYWVDADEKSKECY